MPKKTEIELLAPSPESYAELIRQIVNERIAEIQADKEAEIFQPFFELREVADQMRRQQHVQERRKWAVYMETYGCLICQKAGGHNALGMCRDCFSRVRQRLYAIRRDLVVKEPGEVTFRDTARIARQALLPSVEKLARKRRGHRERPAIANK